MSECQCGNPKLGFDCICKWVEKHPGNKEFACIFCGLYRASKPRCNECEDITNWGTFDESTDSSTF